MKPKDAIWAKFGEPFLPIGDNAGLKSVTYCKCSACENAIIAACGRLRDHWAKCTRRPRAIGQLDAGFKPTRRVTMKKFKQFSSSSSLLTAASSESSQVGLDGSSPFLVSNVGGRTLQSSPASSASFYSGGREHFDFLKPGEREQLNVLLARAIHRTATPYSAFEHPAWKAFFKALQSSYQLPCRAAIGGNLMRAEYVNTMSDVLTVLGMHQLICFTLNGATNLQGKANHQYNDGMRTKGLLFGALHYGIAEGEFSKSAREVVEL